MTTAEGSPNGREAVTVESLRSRYRKELKAAYGHAYLNLIEDKTGKKHAAINLETGEAKYLTPAHRDLLNELVRADIPDLFADVEREETAAAEVVEEVSTKATPVDRKLPGSTDFPTGYSSENVQKGVVAEQRTAGVLSVLLNRPEARVLHSIDLGTRDIDHVLFCTKGVFVINTKYRRSSDSVLKDYAASWSAKVLDDVREIASTTSALAEVCGLDTSTIYRGVISLWTEEAFSVEVTVGDNGTLLLPAVTLPEVIDAGEDVLTPEMAVGLYETLRRKLDG